MYCFENYVYLLYRYLIAYLCYVTNIIQVIISSHHKLENASLLVYVMVTKILSLITLNDLASILIFISYITFPFSDIQT